MSNSKTKSNDVDSPVSLAEHLSTVLDDEAGSFEQRRVLDELTSNESAGNELAEKLSHFALIGESMRSTKPAVVAGPSFLAGIHDKLAAEDEYSNVQLQSTEGVAANDGSNQQQSNSLLRPVGGFALAASFAAVAFMGVQNYQLTNQLAESSAMVTAATEAAQQQNTMQVALDAPVIDAISTNKDSATQGQQKYTVANAHARSFLKRYVDSHVQYASTSTFVPSVRVIAYADY